MATIRKKGELQWHVQVRRKGHPTQTRTFELKEDAEKWAREVERSIDRGEFKDARNAANTTLRQVLENYRDSKAQSNKGKEIDLLRLEVLLASKLAKYSMAAIDHDVIESWCRDYVMENGVKGSTINRYLNLLSAAINLGIKRLKLGIDNPCKKVERLEEPEHRDRRIFGEEEGRLIDALTVNTRPDGKRAISGQRNIWLKPIVEFALETAMRRSEILALEWQYVELKRGVAHLPDTKIGRGEATVSRDVPLTKRAVSILESLPRSIGGRVFPTTAEAVKLGFSRAVVRARKTYEAECHEANETPLARMLTDLHFHDLRHEATSRLSNVYDMKMLAKVGGWRDMNTLAKYYNPTTDELVETMREHEKRASS